MTTVAAFPGPPPVRPAPNLTVGEFVRSIPESMKAAILGELLGELVARHRDHGIVPVQAADGGLIGTLVIAETAAAAADDMYTRLLPAERLALLKPYLDFEWDNCLTDEQVRDMLTAASPPAP